MSTEIKTAPSVGYTVTEHLDKTRSYDCEMCPHSAPDIDGARAHRAAHVAGPDLLEAAEQAQCGCSISQRNSGHDVDCWMPSLDEAIAKARPQRTTP